MPSESLLDQCVNEDLLSAPARLVLASGSSVIVTLTSREKLIASASVDPLEWAGVLSLEEIQSTLPSRDVFGRG